MTWLIVLVLVILALAAILLLWFGLPAYLRLRGKQVVTCPETGEKVSVEVDISQAARDTIRGGQHHLKLRQCTLWPERAGCHELCVGQIESSPEGCHYHSLLGRWFQDKRCALCQTRFQQVHWHDHKPAFMDESGAMKGWEDLPPEQLVENLPNYRPVCWDCQVAKDFRDRYGDLVTDRDWQ